MVRLGESKIVLASRRRSLLLTATRDAIRVRIYGTNPLLVLRPKDVELLLAELIEWRAELLEATTKRRLPQQPIAKEVSYTRRAEYLHSMGSGT
jgi:hypothetical protein